MHLQIYPSPCAHPHPCLHSGLTCAPQSRLLLYVKSIGDMILKRYVQSLGSICISLGTPGLVFPRSVFWFRLSWWASTIFLAICLCECGTFLQAYCIVLFCFAEDYKGCRGRWWGLMCEAGPGVCALPWNPGRAWGAWTAVAECPGLKVPVWPDWLHISPCCSTDHLVFQFVSLWGGDS